MAWLYLPSPTTSTCVPAAECSDSPSSSPSPEGYAPWLTSNGKPTRRPLSWRGWRMRPWITLLSGTTSSPSQTRSSLASFRDSVRLSSPPATPASPSASPASVLASMMSAIYGRTLMRSLARRNPSACFWRTSQGIFGWDSDKSGEISKAEATALRRDYSARAKSARATAGSGCSSLRWNTPAANCAPNSNCNQKDKPGSLLVQAQAWPSPRTEDAESCGNHPDAVDSLTGAVRMWPTPMCSDDGHKVTQSSHQKSLISETMKWPTPRASASANRTMTRGEAVEQGRHGKLLSAEAVMWATPRAGKGTAENSEQWTKRQAEGTVSTPPLAMQAVLWPTPRCAEAGHAGRQKVTEGSTLGLVESAALWPTPVCRDSKGGNSPEHMKVATGRKHLDQLPNYVCHCLPPALRLSMPGSKSSRSTRRLNPRFVEHLMGWPLGWSLIGSALPAMEWCRWQRLMHSSLCLLLCASCDGVAA